MSDDPREEAKRHVASRLAALGAALFAPVAKVAVVDLLARVGEGQYVELQVYVSSDGRFNVGSTRPRRDAFAVLVAHDGQRVGDAYVVPSLAVDRYAAAPSGGSRTLAIDDELARTLAVYRNRWKLIAEFNRFRSAASDPKALQVMLAMEGP
ncbi:MAG: hypothetical protein FJ318_02815 [SAR202 cluster bacterium]|nr:hypothetical protein [SAR202 cluster bacterium]